MSGLAAPREFTDASLPEIATEPAGPCVVCGGERFHDFARGYDYELRTCRNSWNFRACNECGHVQLDPRPAVGALDVIYPAHYYSYNMQTAVSPLALKGKEWLDRMKFTGILRALGRPPQSFLDVGCGDGHYLRFLEKTYGISKDRLYGLELSEPAVKRLRQDGYQVHCKRVEDCTDVPNGGIDLATMFHVIEHVANPAAIVQKIQGWLAPGGLLTVETPNIDSLDARIFRKNYWGGYHIPRHWHLFSAQSLRRLMEASGFEVVAVHFQTGHSFWMYSFHHLLRYRLGWNVLSRMFDPLKALPLLIAFTGFDKARALFGFRTSAILVMCRKRAAD